MIPTGMTFPVEEATVAALRAAMQAGALTAEALATLSIRRIQAIDRSGPALRAVGSEVTLVVDPAHTWAVR